MNKYDKAYELISKSCYPKGNMDIAKALETIKELIDNQSDYMSYQDLKNEYETKISKLEKALDKACEIFENGDKEVSKNHYWNKQKWKEYLLKESEKQ